MPLDVVPWGIVIAAVGGLAIGIEREWSGHAVGPQARFAGVRTFTLLGGVGGVAGWLWTNKRERSRRRETRRTRRSRRKFLKENS